CFDLLIEGGSSLLQLPFSKRRSQLESFFEELPMQGMVRLSQGTTSRSEAEDWMKNLGAFGLDGIVAKRLDELYRSGERTAMVKVKRIRTVDCVVGGF